VSTYYVKIARGLRHLEYFGEVWRCFSVFRRPLRMLAGYLGPFASYPFICETRAGDRIQVADRMDLVTTWIIYLRNEYPVKPEDQVIVDCGANIGVFTIYSASIAPRSQVFAIEPFPETFQSLRENVELNSLDSRVACLPVALAATDGPVNMYAAPHVASQARQVIRPSGADTVSVPALSLSSLFGRIELPMIDLLKMDIEGSEHTVLLHADPCALARVKRIAVEYHQNCPKKPLFDHLQRSGFSLRQDRILGCDYGVAEFVRSSD